jgi:hypothetical protein
LQYFVISIFSIVFLCTGNITVRENNFYYYKGHNVYRPPINCTKEQIHLIIISGKKVSKACILTQSKDIIDSNYMLKPANNGPVIDHGLFFNVPPVKSSQTVRQSLRFYIVGDPLPPVKSIQTVRQSLRDYIVGDPLH